MRKSWLPPDWRGRERIAHPVKWARLPEYDVGIAFVQTRADHGHENRWYLYRRRYNEADIQAIPVLASTVITSSAGSTQTITSDATWNNSGGGNNSIEVIGAGARGAHGASTSTSGGGGGGGAYTRLLDVLIPTPGTTQYFARVGGVTATDGTAGGDTWWTLTSPGTTYPSLGATAVAAKGGTALASATSATGSTGGQLSASYPSGGGELSRTGGTGGNAGASATAGGGGGGAAGQLTGNNGSGTAGGAGNGNSSGGGTAGTAGSPGGAGGAGTNIQTGPNAGSGGGGGGGNAGPSTGGAGGLYGGGGGGGGRSNGTGGQGAQGVIVLTWTPIYTGSLVTTEATDTASITGTATWLATLAAKEDLIYELLLHFDGTDTSTVFPDSGGKSNTVTAHGAAQVDTGQAVFAGQTLQLSADTDYVSADTGDYAFGTGDFCVDLRARLSSATEARMFFDGGSNGFQIAYDGSALKFTSAAGTITGSGLSANTNYHLAATRGSGSTRLWKDGVQTGSTLTDTTNYAGTSGYPRIGGGVGISGSLVATEASDTAAITGAVTGGLDAATTAWIAAVGSGNVDSAHRGYVDTLIVGLKADGIWTKLDRLWILAAQNTNSALVDLKATATATAAGSPTFTADRGYTCVGGSSQTINLNYNCTSDAVNFGVNGHISVWQLLNSTNLSGAITDGIDYVTINPLYAGGTYARVNDNAGALANADARGFFLANRSGSTNRELYKNGVSLGSYGSVSTGGQSNQGLILYDWQNACASVGGNLNSTEQLAFYNRLRTYMTSVGVP